MGVQVLASHQTQKQWRQMGVHQVCTMGKETRKLGVVKPQFSNGHGEKLGRFIFHP